MAYEYEIGATGPGLTLLSALTTPVIDPRHHYQDYSQEIPLASGRVRGGGWRLATWTWDYLTQAQWDQLKTFCAGLSEDVFIRTKIADGSYADFSAVMIFPLEKEQKAGRVLDFIIRFQDLQPYP